MDSIVVIVKEYDTNVHTTNRKDNDNPAIANSIKAIPESPVKSKGVSDSTQDGEKCSDIQQNNCSDDSAIDQEMNELTSAEDPCNHQMEISKTVEVTPKENNIQFTFPSTNFNSPVQKRPPVPFSPKNSPTGILKRWSSLDSPSPSGKVSIIS